MVLSALKGSHPVLKELILPTGKDRRVESEIITKITNRNLVNQLSQQGGSSEWPLSAQDWNFFAFAHSVFVRCQ